MKYLVLGSGLMGYACIFDLINSKKVEKVTTIDINQDNLTKTKNKVNSEKLETKLLNINDTDSLLKLMKDHNTVISAISYKFNYDLSKLAIEAGCNFCDLGGNNTIVEKQYSLNNLAKEKNVTVIPDCGLAPGVVSNLTTFISDKFDTIDHIKIRVGGLPQKPEPPMNYSLFFSSEGLINEYYEIPVLVRNHKEIEGLPLGDLEELSFEKFPELEAFNTSGGTSTLTKTMKNRVKNLDYKTIRYKGHRDQCKLLLDLGLMDEQEIFVKDQKIVPRKVLMHLLEKKLESNRKDVVLVRVEGEGQKNGHKATHKIEIVDYYDEKNHISAMMRMTAFPLSIIAQMMANGEIKQKGVVASELVVDYEKLINELKHRNIDIKIS